MKKIIILTFFCHVLFLVSCGKMTGSAAPKNDSVWNEKIQDTFYDMKLGDTLSIMDIVNNLYSKGFRFIATYSDEKVLRFDPLMSKSFSFGGLSWEHLNIYRENGIFTKIDFYNVSKDKACALESYESIKGALQNKYKPTPQEPADTTVYAFCNFYGKNNVKVQCNCRRGESVSKQIYIYTNLCYSYKNDMISNDL